MENRFPNGVKIGFYFSVSIANTHAMAKFGSGVTHGNLVAFQKKT